MTAQTIVEVDEIDCLFEPKPWAFAIDRAEAIDRLWAAACAAKPKLFNGRVLLLHRGALEPRPGGGTLFRAAYLETDFKAFLAWRDLGFPEAGVRNGFGMAALYGSDGAFVLGEMNLHTANAGLIYFASGTPDPSDLVGNRVDIEGSVRRELREETGLSADDVQFEAGFTLVMDDHRVGFMKGTRFPGTAEAAKIRIEAFLAADPEPELARIHIIGRQAEIGPAVQVSCAAYLRAKLER